MPGDSIADPKKEHQQWCSFSIETDRIMERVRELRRKYRDRYKDPEFNGYFESTVHAIMSIDVQDENYTDKEDSMFLQLEARFKLLPKYENGE